MKKNKINGKPLPKSSLYYAVHNKSNEQLADILFGVPPKESDDVYQFEATKREQLLGVPPESEPISLFSKYSNSFTVHKSSKNGQLSFRITKGLLDSLIETSIKIQKQPKLVLEIANEYTLTCSITKK